MISVISNSLKQGFSIGETTPEKARNLIYRQIVIVVCIVLLAVVLHPDLFGLIPNSLDPMFYTGYSINLDDALAAAGNRHYFVTRWSSYLPQYVSCQIFGPYWGRLVIRILMLSILSEVFWRFGEKLKLSRQARAVSIFVFMLTPMFLRAFTTDYPEYTATFYGILLVTLIASQKIDWRKGAAFGVLAALMLISNPFTYFLIGGSALVWVFLNYRSTRFVQIVLAGFTAACGATVVVIAGYLLFRFHYRIGNVYTPTLNFMRTYSPQGKDLWTSPGKEWAGHFGWLYLPLTLAATSQFLVRPKDTDVKRLTRTLQFLVVFVSAYHVAMQLTKGHALETSYYWAMGLPAFYVLLFLSIGYLVNRFEKSFIGISVVITVLALIRLELPQKLHFGANIALAIGILAIFVVTVSVNRISRIVSTLLLISGIFWMQLGSPPYKTLTYGGDSNTPRYDLVFGHQSRISNDILHETIWFTDQLDTLGDDWKSTFMSAGGWSAAIVGTYIPHPFSRWIVPVNQLEPLTSNVRNELEFGARRYLVVFGDANEVAKILPGVHSQLPRSKVLIDKTHTSALKYRLVVLTGSSGAFATSNILPSSLDRNIGIPQSDGSVLIPQSTAVGFATFGPYFSLGTGKYVATLEYETAELGMIGRFEMFSDADSRTAASSIVASHKGVSTVQVPFTVTDLDNTWQIRTEYSGQIEVRLLNIRIERSSVK